MLLIFKTLFKCFKRIANIQKTLLQFQTCYEYSEHVSHVSNMLLILKCIVNVTTALYAQRVANSRKKNNTRQVSATVSQRSKPRYRDQYSTPPLAIKGHSPGVVHLHG